MYGPSYTKEVIMMQAEASSVSAELSSVRKEVLDFSRAAEAILSPSFLGSELTPSECDLIAEYVKSLCQFKNPWSQSLPIKYT